MTQMFFWYFYFELVFATVRSCTSKKSVQSKKSVPIKKLDIYCPVMDFYEAQFFPEKKHVNTLAVSLVKNGPVFSWVNKSRRFVYEWFSYVKWIKGE